MGQVAPGAPLPLNTHTSINLVSLESLGHVRLRTFDLRKLQCVQNSLGRIVTNTTKYSHITPVWKTLHWLSIEHRSIFKTALLVYKFLHSGYL